MAQRRVLIVDDDQDLLESLEASLAGRGYAVQTVADAAAAYQQLDSIRPDVLVLDIGLGRFFAGGVPIEDGLGLLRLIRRDSDIPILMLSVTAAETVKILALELGADDYVTKPFSVGELAARLNAIIRRCATAAGTVGQLRFDKLVIDLETREVRVGERRVELTLTEFRILKALAKAQGRVLTRRQILVAAHGVGYHGEERAVDVHVRHLRQKLESESRRPEILLTVRGLGYRLGLAGAGDDSHGGSL